MEAKNTKRLDEVTIEDDDEVSKDEFLHLIIKPTNYNICMLLNKGKGIVTNKKIVVDIAKQLSTIIDNAYEHNPGCSKEEHEIKLDALFDAQEDDYFQKDSEE